MPGLLVLSDDLDAVLECVGKYAGLEQTFNDQ
jgi:hypothetical protein